MSWDDAGAALGAAAEIVHLITQLMTQKRVDRVATAWPSIRAQLEKSRADLKAAIKFNGRAGP